MYDLYYREGKEGVREGEREGFSAQYLATGEQVLVHGVHLVHKNVSFQWQFGGGGGG